jgi:glycosyltransferase involved in cell wall biosynthesis
MRILVVIYEFPPIGGGGGRAAHDICRKLAARGHEVTVLTAHMRGLPLEELQDGIRIVRVRSRRAEPFRATFPVMLAYVLAGLWTGLRVIQSARPTLIHTHFAVPSGALAWMLSVLTGIPYVLTVHLGDVPGGVPEKTGKWFRWLKPFTHPIWTRARRIVAVSEHTRQLALQHYPVEIAVIPNGTDVKFSVPDDVQLNHPPQLVFAGRFVSQKDPLAIVRILSELKDVAWRCAMLGDGPLWEDVKREIERNGLQERFHLPGWVTPQDVLQQFSKSDILLMPSLSEGLPVTGVQALAAGLAIVVSKIGGFVDLVDEGENGFLIETHDQQKFVQVLKNLMLDAELLKRCRQKSMQKSHMFDISKIAGRYETIFEEISRAH